MEQYHEGCCKGCSTVVFDNTLQGNQEIFNFGEFYIIIKEGKNANSKFVYYLEWYLIPFLVLLFIV